MAHITPSISIEDNNTLLQEPNTLQATLLIGKNYATYCISHINKKIVYNLTHYQSENTIIGKNTLNQIYADSLLQSASIIHIGIDSSKQILLPLEIFNPTQAQHYLSQHHHIEPDEVTHTSILNNEYANIFTIKKNTLDYLLSKFNQPIIHHTPTTILHTYPSHINVEHDATLFILLNDETFVLTVYKKNTLHLHRQYDFTTHTDIHYYIQNTFQQLSINQAQTAIILHSNLEIIHSLYAYLTHYYSHIKYISRVRNLTFADKILEQPAHQFYNLFSLVTCA